MQQDARMMHKEEQAALEEKGSTKMIMLTLGFPAKHRYTPKTLTHFVSKRVKANRKIIEVLHNLHLGKTQNSETMKGLSLQTNPK